MEFCRYSLVFDAFASFDTNVETFKVHLKSYVSETVARQPAALLKESLQHSDSNVFLGAFAKILRTPLFIEHLRWLLLYISRWLSKFRDNLKALSQPSQTFWPP